MNPVVNTLLLVMPALGGGPPQPNVEITPILHTGDPAPGIPESAMVWMGAPLIDGCGNVLIPGLFQRDGEPFSQWGLWHGVGGSLDAIAFDGMQAADMPEGVIYGGEVDAPNMAEDGTIGFRAWLDGPGIVSGINDRALFVGPPDDIRKVFQGGDTPPDVEPGTVISLNPSIGQLRPWITDNGTVMVLLRLAGPQVNDENDRGLWIGQRDDMRLIFREGMDAPGTGGARFAWSDFQKCNDAGQIAFRAGLVIEGDVDHTNDVGIWSGEIANLELVMRQGDQAAGLPDGVLYDGANPPALNAAGDIGFSNPLRGAGVTPENNHALWVAGTTGIELLGRKGDPVPEIGPDVELAAVGSSQISARQDVLHYVKYTGPPIEDANAWATYFGPSDNPEQTLRDGDPAPQFPDGIQLSHVGGIPSLGAMNDTGNIVAPTEITGKDVTDDDKVVVWIRDHVRRDWYPLLRTGDVIEGQIFSVDASGDLGTAFRNKTGGSDGLPQSLNDSRELGIKLEFADGTHGVFVTRFRWLGDADGDADVDFADFRDLQRCFTGPGLPFGQACDPFDFDEDEDVDLVDYQGFLEGVTGPR